MPVELFVSDEKRFGIDLLGQGEMHYKDEIMPKYAELIYNGMWFSPEREMMQKSIDEAAQHVSGHGQSKAV